MNLTDDSLLLVWWVTRNDFEKNLEVNMSKLPDYISEGYVKARNGGCRMFIHSTIQIDRVISPSITNLSHRGIVFFKSDYELVKSFNGIIADVLGTVIYPMIVPITEVKPSTMPDTDIALKYINKKQSAEARGLEFNLSFTSFKNLMKSKRCKYTGVKLTDPRTGNGNLLQTDRTIDRIDSKKGYVKGNVVAVCNAANTFKSKFEGEDKVIGIEEATKILNLLKRISK